MIYITAHRKSFEHNNLEEPGLPLAQNIRHDGAIRPQLPPGPAAGTPGGAPCAPQPPTGGLDGSSAQRTRTS